MKLNDRRNTPLYRLLAGQLETVGLGVVLSCMTALTTFTFGAIAISLEALLTSPVRAVTLQDATIVLLIMVASIAFGAFASAIGFVLWPILAYGLVTEKAFLFVNSATSYCGVGMGREIDDLTFYIPMVPAVVVGTILMFGRLIEPIERLFGGGREGRMSSRIVLPTAVSFILMAVLVQRHSMFLDAGCFE